MLTEPIARKSQKLWPSLSSGGAASSSFFADEPRKLVQVSGKAMMATPQLKPPVDEEDEDEVELCKGRPIYQNQLGDCLANALAKSVSLKEVKGNRKKKTKKVLLFTSGMNFN